MLRASSVLNPLRTSSTSPPFFNSFKNRWFASSLSGVNPKKQVEAKIVVLPGDGIGPEITVHAVESLRAVAERRGHSFQFVEKDFGAIAIDRSGVPLPPSTLSACQDQDVKAVLLGAVGDPRYDGKPVRPEQGLLGLRESLKLFANIRPVSILSPKLSRRISPLRPERLDGVDFVVVRELTGGVYFGERKEYNEVDRCASDTMNYSEEEVERIIRVAADIAMQRRKILTSVDKNNVLATSRLWRKVAERVVREEYPQLQLNHMLVDAMAMDILRAPAELDVVVTENMFGDILSDETSMLPGSLGLLPSASLSASGFGLYEPIHGSAPDIAGKGIANPVGTILSAAMLLRHSLNLPDEAAAIERACADILNRGILTPDVAPPGSQPATTEEVGQAIVNRIRELLPDVPQTLYDKIIDFHSVKKNSDGTVLMYVDRHLVHEVTSPQAFEGLRTNGRPVRRPDCTLVTLDHNIPTTSRKTFSDLESFIEEPESRTQCVTLEENVKEFGLTYFGMRDKRQGIVHVIGPEQGFTLPGSTVVCGDSHTATHGAFGALAFGIGTSEVEHVLATQTLLQTPAKNMLIRVNGALPPGVTSKDLILYIIGQIGTAGGTGHTIEFTGNTISKLSMESRMSICNMAIEAGARAGLIAPDEVTFEYLKGRPMAPSEDQWDAAINYWRTLHSDIGALFDKEIDIHAPDIPPTVTWGTSPEDTVPITGSVPDPRSQQDPAKRASMEQALQYMGLEPGTSISEIPIDKVFIGSCTNSRIEDLREVAAIAKGRKVAAHVDAMIVPGSGLVKEQAEQEGLDIIFKEANFDWREPGCSMCLGMNPDQLKPKERCASTSNRNFEGRQGTGGRTHLLSPSMAAAAAIAGHLADVRQFSAASIPSPQPKNPRSSRSSNKKRRHIEICSEPSGKQTSGGGSSSSTDTPSSGMTSFTVLTGISAPLNRANIDTDMIIPKQFLKTIQRAGLGKHAFSSLRYQSNGSENPEFVLNKPQYRNSCILVAGANFGCGSSREHAPWALSDFGIRCVIAESFADIFFNNCFKNGMLPIILGKEEIQTLLEDCEKGPLTVDLEKQIITRYNGSQIPFEVDSGRKERLLKGLDDIDVTLNDHEAISEYEKNRSKNYPWLDGSVLVD